MSAAPLGPNYRKLWSASAVSNLGDGVRLTALPLMAAALTRDPGKIAALSFATSLPWLLFSLVAGALVDRLDRKRVMGRANVFRTAVMLVLAVAVASGNPHLYLLYAVGFLLGMAETMFDNASQTIMPSIVDKSELERANGRMYAAEITTNQFAGPPLGAFLFTVAAAAPFFLDAASFAISALLILALDTSGRARSREPRASKLRAEIAEGLRWLWNHRLLRTLGILLGLQNMLFSATFAIFVLYVLEILGLGPVGFGILEAVGTVGAVLGSLLTSSIAKRTGSGPPLIASLTLSAISFTVMAITSDAVIVGLTSVAIGFAATGWNVITVSMRQSIIPDHLLGRVNSVYRLLGWGTMPLGAALGGALASGFGLRAPFVVAAIAYALMTLAALPLVNNRTIAEARAAAV